VKRVHVRSDARPGRATTLYFDFMWDGQRWREFTRLEESEKNRELCEAKAAEMSAQIVLGTFDPAIHFPDSPRAPKVPRPERITVADFVRTVWLPHKQAEMSARAYRELEQIAETRICAQEGADKQLGLVLLDGLDSEELDAFVIWLRALPGIRGRKLSPARTRKILGHVRSILRLAYKRGYIDKDLSGDLPKQRVRKARILPFSPPEKIKFLAALEEEFWDNYFTTAFDTGLRPSEQLSLLWVCKDELSSYVDFDRNVLVVRQGVDEGEETDLKTEGSLRDVPMQPTVRAALLRQRTLTQHLGPRVFPNGAGNAWNLSNIRNRIWSPTLTRAGIVLRNLYTTRHTFATTALSAGEDPNWVARIMGTSLRMIMETYWRYLPNLNRHDGSALTKVLANMGRLAHRRRRTR
jgi:integrase